MGLLCYDRRHREAVQVIEKIQSCLANLSSSLSSESLLCQQQLPNHSSSHRATSRIDIGSDNGRVIALIHAKGNILYNLHDHAGAAKAFEEVVLVAVGSYFQNMDSLIAAIGNALQAHVQYYPSETQQEALAREYLLLPPEKALQTAKLCFPDRGDLPGLRNLENLSAWKAAVAITSNSLLSLAKIFQDNMSTHGLAPGMKSHHGIRNILTLYYLSLSLQPSPSTANNVGILLASVQPNASKAPPPVQSNDSFMFPGVIPGSGIALALTYYKYGLTLDSRHAHLFTNLGSLLKDIGQLPLAIQMYERAVICDPKFDIALANLANAVKDQGRISDAITYYKRAVNVNSGFAEAACGLANALNSVCEWKGRGGVVFHDRAFDRWHVDDTGQLVDARTSISKGFGWIQKVVDTVENQLADGSVWGRHALTDDYITALSYQLGACQDQATSPSQIAKWMQSWKGGRWEGAKVVWLVERMIRKLAWAWYRNRFVLGKELPTWNYNRPALPPALSTAGAPTVLPFHTFTLPMTAKQIRLISQRNGLRVSSSTLRSSWLPPTVYPPPVPPMPQLKVGYVSSDFNNHPLAHLMQSVFGLHDRSEVESHCYAITASDNSIHRQQIERESPYFCDASAWSAEKLVNKIVEDGIHILVNLNGYTRGARNEIFAARPVPIQMSFMGFAGTLGAEWCDYLLADEVAVPSTMLRPGRRNVDISDLATNENVGGKHEGWMYAENIIYSRDTFFCCDHRQSAPDAKAPKLSWESEQNRRWKMRKELFPDLADDVIIFGNFNQLYKVCFRILFCMF